MGAIPTEGMAPIHSVLPKSFKLGYNLSIMKILITTGIYPPSIGGPATYSRLLNEELPHYGIKTSVLSFDAVRHLPPVFRHFLFFLKVLWRGSKVDVIYAQDLVSVGFPTACANLLLRKKFIVKMVGDHVWEQGVQRFGIKESLDEFSRSNQKQHFYLRFLKSLRNWVSQRALIIIVPSNYLKKIVFNWGVAQDKIKVIYNAFEGIEVPSESYDEIRSSFGFHGPIIISVGRLVPWKGFRVLIDVVNEISKDIKDIKLLIVGDGPDREMLQKKIDDENLVDTVALTGKMSQKELFRYIKASNVFVLNTQYEGFSHQLLEVMALGVPIVTTSVGGNAELIESGLNGIMVSYNDKKSLSLAILTLIKIKEEGKTLVLEAQKTLLSFTKEKMLTEFIQELNKICPN
ncbi:MAG: glycosyltransferase family 4 protein [Candidatus Taylorbacteria bacterium]|nr:glycosyltransferase family 4 protein [Candidatus Taylorbacteria bacterium]